MKKIMTTLLASAALLAAVPATASAHEGDRNGDWRGRDSAYASFSRQFQHLESGVRHGLRDGSYNRREARQFFAMISENRRRLDFYWRNDGDLNRWERRDVQRRLDRLHEIMHVAHDQGHDEHNYGYGDRDRYGDRDYNRDYDRYPDSRRR